MSSLLDARASYVAIMQAAPALAGVHVYTHGGTFDQEQLAEYARQAPALVLALLKFMPVIQGGVVTAEATWGLIAFTINKPGIPRDVSCVALAEAAVTTLLYAFTGPGGVRSRPHKMDAKNMFGTKMNRTDVAMWGIEFEQTLDLEQSIETFDLDLVHVDWDLAPRDNNADLGAVIDASDDIDPNV